MSGGTWFFRVIELDDGRWACRRGSEEFDAHVAFDDAVEHIREIAVRHVPAELFAHSLDGTVRRLGVVG